MNKYTSLVVVFIVGCNNEECKSPNTHDIMQISNACQDGCVPFTGYSIDDVKHCVDITGGVNTIIGCRGELSAISHLEACYYSEELMMHVYTNARNDEMLAQGWQYCDSDYWASISIGCDP